jgi:hypothetical protein
VPFAELGAAIASAPSAVGAPDVIAVRTILVRPSGQPWTHLRTVLRVGEGAELPEQEVVTHDWGDAQMIGMRLTTAEFLDVTDEPGEALALALNFWHHHLDLPESLLAVAPFQPQVNLYWERSQNRWSDRPCWRVEPTDKVGTTGWRRDPDGPFFRPGLPFAVDIAAAARQWLKEPATRNEGVSLNSYSVIIPDYRARLRDIKLDGGALRIAVEMPRPFPVFCAIEATDLDGQPVTPQPVPVGDGGTAVVELPRALRALEVYLFDNAGNVLDDYLESGHSLSWGRSVLSPGRRPGDPDHRAVDQAREAGEGQQIEFKEWVPLTRADPKALELLETVIAFANAQGGSLYVGVTDYAEIVGVAAKLYKALARHQGSDLDRLRDAYIVGLQKLIAEGVLPQLTPPPEFKWVEDTGHWVLRATIAKGPDQPYHLAESNDFYIRRGATNRRMTRDELERAFRRQPAGRFPLR